MSGSQVAASTGGGCGCCRAAMHGGPNVLSWLPHSGAGSQGGVCSVEAQAHGTVLEGPPRPMTASPHDSLAPLDWQHSPCPQPHASSLGKPAWLRSQAASLGASDLSSVTFQPQQQQQQHASGGWPLPPPPPPQEQQQQHWPGSYNEALHQQQPTNFVSSQQDAAARARMASILYPADSGAPGHDAVMMYYYTAPLSQAPCRTIAGCRGGGKLQGVHTVCA